MTLDSLLPNLKLHARIVGTTEDVGLLLILEAAAGDVLHAAGMARPDDVDDLPADLRFALIDHAAKLYDQRGMDHAPPGLSLAASRIVHRYRGVRIDTPAPAEGGDE